MDVEKIEKEVDEVIEKLYPKKSLFSENSKIKKEQNLSQKKEKMQIDEDFARFLQEEKRRKREDEKDFNEIFRYE